MRLAAVADRSKATQVQHLEAEFHVLNKAFSAGSIRSYALSIKRCMALRKAGSPEQSVQMSTFSVKGKVKLRRCANSSDTPLFSGLRGKAGHEDNGAEPCLAFPGERNACEASNAERRRCLTLSQILGTFVRTDWAAYDYIYPLFHSDDSTNPPPEMIFGKEDIRSTMWTGWVPSVTTSILVSPCKEEEPDAVDEVQSIRGERPTAEHDQSARHSSSFRRKVGQQMPTIRYRAGMESYLLERGKRGRTQLPSLVSKTPAVRRRDASKHHATSAQHTEMPSD
ncbi:hypothetical protein Landi51_11833 [Colletotrichum acutatum]